MTNRGRLLRSTAPTRPRPGAPQRPDDENRLEQQPNTAGEIGIQPERISVGDQLRHVSREHRHEERCHYPANLGAPAWETEQGPCQAQLHHTRDEHDRLRCR